MTTQMPATVPSGNTLPAAPSRAAERFARAALAPNTRRAYRQAMAAWRAWAEERGRPFLPAQAPDVAAWMAEEAEAGRSPSTLAVRLAGLRWAHEAAGYPDPTADKRVKATMAGIRRTLGTAPRRQAEPLTLDRLTAALAPLDRTTLHGARDAALVLVAFFAGLRRSEAVALRVEDLAEREGGIVVRLRRSKSDQEGRGVEVGLPAFPRHEVCPVRALRQWLDLAGLTSGPLFRGIVGGQVAPAALSERSVSLVFKRLAKRAGLDPAAFSGHSARAGLATSCAERGVPLSALMRATRHRKAETLLGYVRSAELLADHPARWLT